MLQRLARTMYRRRRYVLVGWIVLLVATFMLASSVGGRVQDRVQAPGHREPGGLRPAREVELPQPSDPGPDRVRLATTAIDQPEIQEAMEQLFAEVEEKIADVDVASPYTEEGARQISRNGTDRLRGGQLRRPVRRGAHRGRQGDQAVRRGHRRSRPHHRVRRRRLRRPGGRRRQRGHRHRWPR